MKKSIILTICTTILNLSCVGMQQTATNDPYSKIVKQKNIFVNHYYDTKRALAFLEQIQALDNNQKNKKKSPKDQIAILNSYIYNYNLNLSGRKPDYPSDTSQETITTAFIARDQKIAQKIVSAGIGIQNSIIKEYAYKNPSSWSNFIFGTFSFGSLFAYSLAYKYPWWATVLSGIGTLGFGLSMLSRKAHTKNLKISNNALTIIIQQAANLIPKSELLKLMNKKQ